MFRTGLSRRGHCPDLRGANSNSGLRQKGWEAFARFLLFSALTGSMFRIVMLEIDTAFQPLLKVKKLKNKVRKFLRARLNRQYQLLYGN
jgi:hypothetical protein